MASRREAHQALKKAYLALPEGTDGDHNVRPPNKPIKLYGGVFEIHQDGIPIKMQGTIEHHWYPYPGVRFKGRPTGKWVPDLGDARLRIPKRFATANVQVTECTQGTRPRASGLISGIVRIGQNRAIRAIKFYLPNFHDYVGNPVRFIRGDRMWRSASRITLSADGWRVFVDQDPEYHKLLDLLKARGGFGVGHVCLLTRSDGSRFKVHEASDFLSTLHFFFSFLRGLWCGPIIVTGVGRRGTLWTEWGSWRISDWRGVSSWLPKHDLNGLDHAFKTFRRLWSDPIWNQPLRELVHWYIEANLHAGALEGSLIIGHTALDLLSWMHLVVDKRWTSSKIPGTAAERLEMALRHFKIPSVLPVELKGVKRLGTLKSMTSGPRIVSKFRNAIVHPTAVNRKFLDQATTRDRYDLLQLCLSYLELGILAVLDYQGEYLSRLKAGVSMAEATTKVPWI